MPDERWKALISEDYVSEVAEGAADINYLAKKYRLYWPTNTIELSTSSPKMLKKKSRRFVDEKLSRKRQKAVSFLLAKAAENEPDVMNFRLSYLNNKLLKDREVDRWINCQAIEDEKFSKLTNNPKVLEYGVPGDEWRHIQPITPKGVLSELKKTSEEVSGAWGWTEAQATQFILTGSVPELQSIAFNTHINLRVGAASRIIIIVDPTTKPDVVFKLYQQYRTRLLGRKYRSLTEKHLELAIFNLDQPADKTWAEKMHLWNKRCEKQDKPNWQYFETSNFGRDCRQAHSRLSEPLPDLHVGADGIFEHLRDWQNSEEDQ